MMEFVSMKELLEDPICTRCDKSLYAQLDEQMAAWCRDHRFMADEGPVVCGNCFLLEGLAVTEIK